MSIKVILSKVGPLPLTATFDAPADSPMYLEVVGSVYSSNANRLLGIAVQLDNKPIGTPAQIWSNGINTHRAVVPAYIPVQLQFGKHTLTLTAANGDTVSDLNDTFTVVLHY